MKSTDKIELAETHAIALSIGRMKKASAGGNCWKRALYHALLIAGCQYEGGVGHDALKAIREAMRLP